MKNLIAAYDHPEQAQEALAHAKYWYEKWKTEYKDEYEAIQSTDIAEGTARYAEYFSTFIREGLSKEEIHEEARKHIQFDETFLSADAESYELGYVTALLLDTHQPEWKKDFYTKETTMEDLLLADITPKEQEMDANIQNELTDFLTSYRGKVDQDLANITKALDDTTIPYLVIDKTDSHSSFSAEGMFAYREEPVITNFSSEYGVGNQSIAIRNTSIIEDYTETADTILVPLTMEHKFEDGNLSIDTENVSLKNIPVQTDTDPDGRPLYKVKVDH